MQYPGVFTTSLYRCRCHDCKNVFGRASNKQIMPGYLTPVMLEVPVVVTMSEICGINDNNMVVKELHEIISTMSVGKASDYDHNL